MVLRAEAMALVLCLARIAHTEPGVEDSEATRPATLYSRFALAARYSYTSSTASDGACCAAVTVT